MDALTLPARIDFPVDSPDAVLTFNGHRYAIRWDDEHPNPRPAAERLMAQYEHAVCTGPWAPNPSRKNVPTGWTTTAQFVEGPVLTHA